MAKNLMVVALFGLLAVALGADVPAKKSEDLQTQSSAFYGYSPYGVGYGYGLGYGGFGGYGLGGYGLGYGGYGLGGYGGGYGLGYGGYGGYYGGYGGYGGYGLYR